MRFSSVIHLDVRRSPIRQASRAGAALAVFAALVLVGGCGRWKEPEKPDPAEVKWEGKPLELGQSEYFEFPADGEWHKSNVLAYRDHKLGIRAAGESQALDATAIQFRIGGREQIVSPQEFFVVTKPGRIDFRLDPARTARFQGMVKVEMTRNP